MPLSFRPTRRLIIAASLACLGAAACRQPVEPRDIAGRYVLVEFGGAALPHPIAATASLTAESLELATDGSGTWNFAYAVLDSAAEATVRRPDSYRVRVREQAGALVLQAFICPDGADCSVGWDAPMPIARIGDRLYIGRPPTVRTFERTAP